MSTGRWAELREEHEVRYTWNGTSFEKAMSKTSTVTLGYYGLVVGVSGPNMRLRSFPRLVVSREFQSTCLAMRSPAIRTGNPPPNKRSGPLRSMGGKVEVVR